MGGSHGAACLGVRWAPVGSFFPLLPPGALCFVRILMLREQCSDNRYVFLVVQFFKIMFSVTVCSWLPFCVYINRDIVVLVKWGSCILANDLVSKSASEIPLSYVLSKYLICV